VQCDVVHVKREKKIEALRLELREKTMEPPEALEGKGERPEVTSHTNNIVQPYLPY
jgi:hypothetical protein